MFYKPEREHIRNIDDIIYGYKKEKPQKGRFWLLFLIAFILAFAFNFFFNVITTKAQVVYPIFSQQNGSASTTFAGALPILQTNFNLSEASSTISSLTFRLQYNSGNWIGRQHKVCIGENIG
jgi:hypothetical protein